MNNPTDIVNITLVLDTNIYASGDLLADTTLVSNALSGDFRSGIIQTVTVIDKDKQGVAFDIWTLDANVSFGTFNLAPTISAANALNIMGHIAVGTADYFTFSNFKIAHITGLAIPVHAIDTTRDIALAVVNGTGTPTFTASGITLRLGILRDQHTN